MGPTCRPICLLLTRIVGITNVQWQTLFYDFENYLISNAILLHKTESSYNNNEIGQILFLEYCDIAS
jgi:hypothetical protein